MSSLKMTFSLASLVLILGLVFVTAPAMAQIDQIADLGDAVADAGNVTNIIGITDNEIPANGHLVLFKAATAAEAGLPTTGTVFARWENMPDLEELFFGNAGGTIALMGTKTALNGTTLVGTLDFRFDHDGDDQFGTPVAPHNTVGDSLGDGNKDNAAGTANLDPVKAASADEDPSDAAAAITEIMWGLDNAEAGEAAVDDRQWIEIHNRLSVDLPLAGLFIHIKSGRPGNSAIPKADVPTKLNEAKTEADPQGTTVLDWMSNVDGNGWGGNTPPGQSGFAIADDATEITNRIDFVSMYRSKLGKTDGAVLGNWIASTNVYRAGYKGTPGASERTGPKGFSASTVSLDVILSEVANRKTADKAYEWIELLVLEGDPHFENWRVSVITAPNLAGQKELFTLPKLDVARFDDILLITATDPQDDQDHPLAAGYDVSKKIEDQTEEGRDSSIRYYVADWKDELPDGKEFVLILRSNKDKTNHETVMDIAGFVKDLGVHTSDFDSNQWPLIGHGAPASDKNKFVEDTVQRRQHTGILGTGTTHGDKKDGQVAYVDATWTGIGY